jgi:hypothetical protein
VLVCEQRDDAHSRDHQQEVEHDVPRGGHVTLVGDQIREGNVQEAGSVEGKQVRTCVVHRGQADSLDVLMRLLEGAPSRLAPGGSLYIVAQGHVPVAPLAEATHAFASVASTACEGARFTVTECRVEA